METTTHDVTPKPDKQPKFQKVPDGMKEALGTVIARYTYDEKPEAILMETDIVLRFEIAMLDGMGKLDFVADSDGHTYRELFRMFRTQWMRAMEIYNPVTGTWKDAVNMCSQILDNLIRIAVKEEMINISKDHFEMRIESGGFIGAIRRFFSGRASPA